MIFFQLGSNPLFNMRRIILQKLTKLWPNIFIYNRKTTTTKIDSPAIHRKYYVLLSETRWCCCLAVSYQLRSTVENHRRGGETKIAPPPSPPAATPTIITHATNKYIIYTIHPYTLNTFTCDACLSKVDLLPLTPFALTTRTHK